MRPPGWKTLAFALSSMIKVNGSLHESTQARLSASPTKLNLHDKLYRASRVLVSSAVRNKARPQAFALSLLKDSRLTRRAVQCLESG